MSVKILKYTHFVEIHTTLWCKSVAESLDILSSTVAPKTNESAPVLKCQYPYVFNLIFNNFYVFIDFYFYVFINFKFSFFSIFIMKSSTVSPKTNESSIVQKCKYFLCLIQLFTLFIHFHFYVFIHFNFYVLVIFMF